MPTNPSTLYRLRVVVMLADMDVAQLRHMRDNGASWPEIAGTVSTLSGRIFTAWDAERVTEAGVA